MYKSELTTNDVFLTSSSIINEICKPLEKIGIHCVSYLKNYSDGSQINLSTSAEWIEHYYKFKLYESSLFEENPTGYTSGYFLWPEESNLDVFKHGRNYFDSDHGITIIEKTEQYCEFFFFSGCQRNKWLSNLYVNNLDVLGNFVLYFKEKLQEILKEADKSRILIPQKYCQSTLEEMEIGNLFEQEISALKQKFSDIIPLSSKLPFNRKTFALLSARELEIATCLLNGKTAKETARKLFVSPRTVEWHLDNIKIKLCCRTKFELVNKMLNIDEGGD